MVANVGDLSCLTPFISHDVSEVRPSAPFAPRAAPDAPPRPGPARPLSRIGWSRWQLRGPPCAGGATCPGVGPLRSSWRLCDVPGSRRALTPRAARGRMSPRALGGAGVGGAASLGRRFSVLRVSEVLLQPHPFRRNHRQELLSPVNAFTGRPNSHLCAQLQVGGRGPNREWGPSREVGEGRWDGIWETPQQQQPRWSRGCGWGLFLGSDLQPSWFTK